jgi:hypothetical protein
MSLADHICSSLSSKSLISDDPAYISNNEAESPEQEYQIPSVDQSNLGPNSAYQSNYLPPQDPAIQAALTPKDPQKSPGYLRPGRNVPPRIDAFAASKWTVYLPIFLY